MWCDVKIRSYIISYVDVLLDVSCLDPNFCRACIFTIVLSVFDILVDTECNLLLGDVKLGRHDIFSVYFRIASEVIFCNNGIRFIMDGISSCRGHLCLRLAYPQSSMVEVGIYLSRSPVLYAHITVEGHVSQTLDFADNLIIGATREGWNFGGSWALVLTMSQLNRIVVLNVTIHRAINFEGRLLRGFGDITFRQIVSALEKPLSCGILWSSCRSSTRNKGDDVLIIHIGIGSLLTPVSRLIITTLIACLRRSSINFTFKTFGIICANIRG